MEDFDGNNVLDNKSASQEAANDPVILDVVDSGREKFSSDVADDVREAGGNINALEEAGYTEGVIAQANINAEVDAPLPDAVQQSTDIEQGGEQERPKIDPLAIQELIERTGNSLEVIPDGLTDAQINEINRRFKGDQNIDYFLDVLGMEVRLILLKH